MLSPKRVKHRKVMRGRRRGKASRGNFVAFGDFGLMAEECGWITAQQIEAARIAITRHVKRGGQVWIRVFPDKPFTKKPAETRMGKGRGAGGLGGGNTARPYPLRDGRGGPGSGQRSHAAGLPQIAHSHQVRGAGTPAGGSGGEIMKAADLRDLTREELLAKLKEVSGRAFQPELST